MASLMLQLVLQTCQLYFRLDVVFLISAPQFVFLLLAPRVPSALLSSLYDLQFHSVSFLHLLVLLIKRFPLLPLPVFSPSVKLNIPDLQANQPLLAVLPILQFYRHFQVKIYQPDIPRFLRFHGQLLDA